MLFFLSHVVKYKKNERKMDSDDENAELKILIR